MMPCRTGRHRANVHNIKRRTHHVTNERFQKRKQNGVLSAAAGHCGELHRQAGGHTAEPAHLPGRHWHHGGSRPVRARLQRGHGARHGAADVHHFFATMSSDELR